MKHQRCPPTTRYGAGLLLATLATFTPPARAQATWDAAAPCASSPAASGTRGSEGAALCGGAGALSSGGRYIEHRLAVLEADGFGSATVGGISHAGLPGADISAASFGAGLAPTASGPVASTANIPATAGWHLLASTDDAAAGRGGIEPYSSWWLLSAYAGGGNAMKGVETTGDAVRALAVPGNVCATLRSGLQSGSKALNASATNRCNTSINDPAMPEPGTLGLVGAALLGALAAVRGRSGPSGPSGPSGRHPVSPSRR